MAMIDHSRRITELTPEEKRALLADLLRKDMDTAAVPGQLSYGQQAMWFLYQLAPDSVAYNVAFAARIRSEVDIAALQRALQGLVDRHEPLRANFTEHEGKPVQLIHRRREANLDKIDVSEFDDRLLYKRVVDAYREPFDLEQGSMLRACLFSRSDDDHVLLLAAHHIVLDGWAVWVAIDELRQLYAAETSLVVDPLPVLDASFSDYVRWQMDTLSGSTGERLWDYWRDQLGVDLPVLDLPTDRLRPRLQSFNGATHTFRLGQHLSDTVKQLAKDEQTTVYTVLLAAYQALIYRWSGQQDVIVGSPMAGRSRPEFAGLVGDFINMVALRAYLADNPTFRSFLGQVRTTVLGALENQDYPFPLLVNRLAPKPDPSRSPIFQVTFDLQRIQRVGELTDLIIPGKSDARVEFAGLILEPYPMPQQEGQLDLMLQMAEAGGEFHAAIKYNTDLFDAETVERMAEHYRVLLEVFSADPDVTIDSAPMLTGYERQQIVHDWNDTQAMFPEDQCAHQLIEAQVERTPDRIAVEFGDQQVTYRELNERANQLAHHLVALGVGPETLVGIYLERSIDMIVALLAVHKAGGAYVPLDPTHPAERLQFIMEDADAAVLITTSTMRPDQLLKQDDSEAPARIVNLDLDASTIEEQSKSNVNRQVAPRNLAYIIHTSGSTGRPKGMQIEQRSLVSFLHSFQRTPGMTADDFVLARTTLSFDPSIVETFLPLMIGARIVLLDSRAAGSGDELTQALNTSGATILQVTPSHCRLLLAAGWTGTPGLKLLVGGESLKRDLADALLSRVDELWNIYGPTETTVWATAARITSDGPITVGRPISNVQTYILNNAMQPNPVGVPGELYIGGTGLARGYRNRPDLSGQSFVEVTTASWAQDGQRSTNGSDPESRLRLYRTGDMARYLDDGSIELLGRADYQMKVRGFRIEPGEIEAVLTDVDGVRDAVVIAREDIQGDQRLVAYLVVDDGNEPAPAQLRRQLKAQLPSYMIPAVFVPLEQFPLTPTGKVDRRSLPLPDQHRDQVDERYAAPETPTEQAVAQIWCDNLGLARVGAYDNFFDLGGHSLLLVEVLAAIEQQLGVRVNPAYAQTQTLRQLATICDEMIARGDVRVPSQEPSRARSVVGAMRRMLDSSPRKEA